MRSLLPVNKAIYQPPVQIIQYESDFLVNRHFQYSFIDEDFYYELNETLFRLPSFKYRRIYDKFLKRHKKRKGLRRIKKRRRKTNKQRRIKWVFYTVTYFKSVVKNDMKLTLYNGIRTTSTIETSIHKDIFRKRKMHPFFRLNFYHVRTLCFPKITEFFQNTNAAYYPFKTILLRVFTKTKSLVGSHRLSFFKELLVQLKRLLRSVASVRLFLHKSSAFIKGRRIRTRRYRKFRRLNFLGFRFKTKRPNNPKWKSVGPRFIPHRSESYTKRRNKRKLHRRFYGIVVKKIRDLKKNRRRFWRKRFNKILPIGVNSKRKNTKFYIFFGRYPITKSRRKFKRYKKVNLKYVKDHTVKYRTPISHYKHHRIFAPHLIYRSSIIKREFCTVSHIDASTIVCKPVRITIQKRFMGKETGHAHKIIHATSKNLDKASSPSALAKIFSSKSKMPETQETPKSTLPASTHTQNNKPTIEKGKEAASSFSKSNLPSVKDKLIIKPQTCVEKVIQEAYKPSIGTSDKNGLNNLKAGFTLDSAKKDLKKDLPAKITTSQNPNVEKPSTQEMPTNMVKTGEPTLENDPAIPFIFVTPPAPPLPSQPYAMEKNETPVFKKQLEDKFLEKENNPQKLAAINNIEQLLEEKRKNQLRKHGLADEKEDSLTKKGNQTFAEVVSPTKYKQTDKLNISNLETLDKTKFSAGILDITNQKDTIILGGIHNHMIIIYYTENDKCILWGYLTSAKENAFELSDTQPFNEKKKQYLAKIKEPFIVNKNDIKNLPFFDKAKENIVENGDEGTNAINQQDVLDKYIQQPHINKKFIEHFTNDILPQIIKNDGIIALYDGTSVTMEDAQKMLDHNEKIIQDKVEKFLQIYNQRKAQFGNGKAMDYLTNLKNSHPIEYEKLLQILNK